MVTSRLKVGVIGVGRVAQAHLEATQALAGEVDLVAVCDTRPEQLAAAAGRFGVPKIYGDWRRTLEDPAIEAVVVCLPNHLHHEVCVAAAQAGKHVLVEKPAALDLTEAREMVAAAQGAGTTLMVGQSRRFSDAMKEVFARLPELGDIMRIDISFLVNFPAPPTPWWTRTGEAGGLVILLQGSHSVDTILWLMGQRPRTVYAASQRQNPAWEGEDEADIVIAFEKALASVHLSLSTSPALHELLIVGRKGTLRMSESVIPGIYAYRYRLEHDGRTVLDAEQQPSSHVLQLREFAQALREGRAPLASGEEVLRTMEVLDAIRRSEREGNVVRLDSQPVAR